MARSFAQAVLMTAAAAAFAASPALAQRGGIAHSYGGSHVVAPRIPGTQPLGGGRPFPIRGIGPPPLGLRAPASPGFTGINPGALRSSSHFYRHNYRHIPQAYFFAPYYYPFLGYSDSAYDAYPPYDAAQDPNVQSAEVTANLLGQQIQNLSAQVQQLRMDQEAARNQQAQPSPEEPPAPSQGEQIPPSPPIRLVLRSGQQIQVQDYAVVDGTFWDFTNQLTRKIPISSIDIPASQKATEDAGAEFPQLGK